MPVQYVAGADSQLAKLSLQSGNKGEELAALSVGEISAALKLLMNLTFHVLFLL